MKAREKTLKDRSRYSEVSISKQNSSFVHNLVSNDGAIFSHSNNTGFMGIMPIMSDYQQDCTSWCETIASGNFLPIQEHSKQKEILLLLDWMFTKTKLIKSCLRVVVHFFWDERWRLLDRLADESWMTGVAHDLETGHDGQDWRTD